MFTVEESKRMFKVDWTTPPELLKPCPECGSTATLLTDYVLDPKGHTIATLRITLDPHDPVAEVVLHLQHAVEKAPFSLFMRRVEDDIGSGFTDPPDREPGRRSSTCQWPYSALVDPTGRFLYVGNLLGKTIAAFAIGVDGALTPVQAASRPVSARGNQRLACATRRPWPCCGGTA